MWEHISYEDGSNPYIVFTEKEWKRIKRKYGKRLVKIIKGFWYVKKEENNYEEF